MGQSTELILEAEIRALNAELVRVEAERTAAERTVRDLLDFFLKNDAVHSHGVSPGNHCLSGSCEFDTAKVKIAVLEARLSEVNNLNLQLLHLLKPSEWDVGKISRITGSSNSSLNGVQMSHQQPAVDSIDSFSSLLDSPIDYPTTSDSITGLSSAPTQQNTPSTTEAVDQASSDLITFEPPDGIQPDQSRVKASSNNVKYIRYFASKSITADVKQQAPQHGLAKGCDNDRKNVPASHSTSSGTVSVQQSDQTQKPERIDDRRRQASEGCLSQPRPWSGGERPVRLRAVLRSPEIARNVVAKYEDDGFDPTAYGNPRGFYEHSIRYDPAANAEGVFRTVIITNLPPTTRLNEVLGHIRGGTVFSCKLMDTALITGTMSAMAVFISEKAAAEYVKMTMHQQSRQQLPRDVVPHVAVLPTATWPVPTWLKEANFTRCLAIFGKPENLTVSQFQRGLEEYHFARGTIENIGIDGDGTVHARFSSIIAAVQAKEKLGDDDHGFHIIFDPDPCAQPLSRSIPSLRA